MGTSASLANGWRSAALFCAGMLASLFAAAEPARPNIVLIVADDIALMDFSAYGGEAHTPNIDALAEQSMVFDHAFCPMAVCAPARAAMLTGLMPSEGGIISNNRMQWTTAYRQDAGAHYLENWSAALNAAGYRCARANHLDEIAS